MEQPWPLHTHVGKRLRFNRDTENRLLPHVFVLTQFELRNSLNQELIKGQLIKGSAGMKLRIRCVLLGVCFKPSEAEHD